MMATDNLTQNVDRLLSAGARAVLVAPNNDGTYHTQPIDSGQSVLNIKRDLLLHLNEYPHSDEWLTQLRDYCDRRLTARRSAEESGRIMVPRWDVQWEMIDTDNLPKANPDVARAS